MIRRIRKLWWLILAWLLAILGDDFWHFNVMELFASIAIIIGAIWAIKGWLSERRRRRERKEIRTNLAVFIDECQDLKVKCANEKEPVPEKEIEDLAKRLDSYIRKNLGEDYIPRMNSSAGLPMQANSISSMEHRNKWGQLNRWMARLDQFIADFRD
jgi:HAMP domain-containing protein